MSDLSKSLQYVNSVGITEVDVVGVDGGDYGHVFGVMASMTEAPLGMRLRCISSQSSPFVQPY